MLESLRSRPRCQEWMDMLTRWRQENKNEHTPLILPLSLCRLETGDVVKIKGVPSYFKIWNKGLCLPTASSRSVCPPFLNCRSFQIQLSGKKEQPPSYGVSLKLNQILVATSISSVSLLAKHILQKWQIVGLGFCGGVGVQVFLSIPSSAKT